MTKALSYVVAFCAAAGIAAVGIQRGTYAAGGSDSSCYALMADAMAAGTLQPTSALVPQVPWPDAAKTFTPGGFVPSELNPSASAPVCAPGFSVLLAPVVSIAGRDALFFVTPLAGALLVWTSFVAGRTLAGAMAGAMSAVLVAASPPVLYQVVQPMNDITTAALWMAVFVSLIRRRWAVAGLCCGLALLVRPNLLPLAVVAGMFVVVADPTGGVKSVARRVGQFGIAAFPFGLLILFLNNALYGSPFKSGYGQLDYLFSASYVRINGPRYLRWLIETHSLFPLLAFAAPFGVSAENRRHVVLALVLIVATCAIYLFYLPFDDWSYLRFLLPAVTLMLVLAAAVTARFFEYVRPVPVRHLAIVVMTAALALLFIRVASDRHAFALQFLEQRYRSAGIVVRDRLPEGAVLLSVWDSGAVRFHGRKEALTWEGLDPAWLDRSLAWLEERGRQPFILVESWEEEGFRRRFGAHSDIGKLDWPPRYEIDRMVRIYDPRDRALHQRQEHVDTEYLWPGRNTKVESRK
jgi:hypothetical protein